MYDLSIEIIIIYLLFLWIYRIQTIALITNFTFRNMLPHAIWIVHPDAVTNNS